MRVQQRVVSSTLELFLFERSLSFWIPLLPSLAQIRGDIVKPPPVVKWEVGHASHDRGAHAVCLRERQVAISH
jgi:hypothetical protein